MLAAWLHVTYLCLSCSVCAQEAPSADAAFRLMVANEEIIESLTPAINRLASAVRDLQLPGHYASQFFAPTATALDLAGPDRSAPEPPKRPDVTEHDWLIQEREIPVADLWTALWEEAFLFDDARFGVLKGAADVDGTFVTTLKFSARGRTGTGNSAAWSGEVDVRWSKSSANEWLVQQWVTRKLKTTQTAMRFFREVLDDAIPDSREVARARASVHERYVREVLLTGGTKFTYPKAYWPYVISWDSLDQHPSVSVVDIDGDGWDDFYVTGRWGKNQLWRNRGNGTFEDIAPQIGLDIDGICNCSLFADYDNDGDADVFIGRSLERSRYYENIGGQFFDKSQESVSSPLPYWVSSMASADVNGDGLLDVYISTYRLPITKPPNVLADEFLNPDERLEWKRRRAQDHPVFRMTGPPNVLLINQGGGRFAPSPQAGGADLWLSTFQSTWSDFDNDGDPDLFVANDYAPDYVFRNDDGKLTDVTTSLAGDVLQGFGMGVSLGDIDNDGFQDPFFTYMYSKAGSRITEMIDGLEPRMYAGVAGNLLLHNTGDRLVKSSASMDVAKTGWSWGGQFADFNNDTFLDLYVANGLYTPPAETATEVDL
ncbi:MAG: VCBS repeat-containing protein [Verrucomicrobia bacterium]|nr:VCBS repeat-containing protein [Verrucomicrobiota bacterium]